MAKQKAKFYVVWQGREPGIYDSWAACEAQVKGVAAKYKGFATRAEAEAAFTSNPEDYITRNAIAKRTIASSASDLQALCADLQRSDLQCNDLQGYARSNGVLIARNDLAHRTARHLSACRGCHR